MGLGEGGREGGVRGGQNVERRSRIERGNGGREGGREQHIPAATAEEGQGGREAAPGKAQRRSLNGFVRVHRP